MADKFDGRHGNPLSAEAFYDIASVLDSQAAGLRAVAEIEAECCRLPDSGRLLSPLEHHRFSFFPKRYANLFSGNCHGQPTGPRTPYPIAY